MCPGPVGKVSTTRVSTRRRRGAPEAPPLPVSRNSRMIKKVPVSQLCVGMYVHDLGGSFLDHSFWRSRFLIQNERKLRRLQESRLEWVLIDTDRGIDVPAGGPDTGAAPAARPVPAEESAPPSARAAAPAPERSSPEQQAFDDAKDIIEGSREQVLQLFADARSEERRVGKGWSTGRPE